MNKAFISEIINFFSEKPVLKAWLFGSYARGEENNESDIDIIVRFDPKAQIGILEHVQMGFDLEKRLNIKVDLVTEGTFYPWIEKNVNKDKVLIYER